MVNVGVQKLAGVWQREEMWLGRVSNASGIDAWRGNAWKEMRDCGKKIEGNRGR